MPANTPKWLPFLFCHCLALCVKAQSPDTSLLPASGQHQSPAAGRQQFQLAEPPPVINWKNVQPSQRSQPSQQSQLGQPFPARQLLFPAALVGYGLVCLNNNELQRVNYKLREEIYLERRTGGVKLDDYLIYAPIAAVYGLNAAGVKGRHSFKDRTFLLLLSQGMAHAASMSIKKVAGVERPDGSNFYSFPSGHTTTAFAAAEFMNQEYRHRSPWYGIGAYASAAAVGYMRMYNNKHWFSDVAAGAGIGIASTKIAYWLYPRIKRKLSPDKPLNTFIMPAYSNGAVGLSLIKTW